MSSSVPTTQTDSRRPFLRHLLHTITTLAIFVVAALVPQIIYIQGLNADQPQRPNIILIMADDMGSGDLGCYNPESKIPTPNLDRLAKEGMRFTDAHTPSAVCTPTRYGLLTGRYCWRSKLKSGVLWGYSPLLIEPGRETIASLLKKQGYATACVGKWHLGLGDQKKTDYSKPLRPGPVTVGFDYFFGIPASLDMDPYVYVENDRPVEEPTETVERSEHRRRDGGGFWRGGPIAPGFRHIDVLPKIGEKSVAFIERQTKEHAGQPFFLYVPLSAPHTPWLPTEEYRNQSEAGYYGDFVVQVDHTIGQILQALEAAGVSDNTLLIVTSDNGSHWPEGDITKYNHRANLHYRGQKADIHEGGHRVPFIVRWPGRVEPNSQSAQLLCLTDLMATIAAVLDFELPENAGEDSFNQLPALRNPNLEQPIRETVIHHSVNGTFAIRRGDWKFIDGLGSGGFTAPRSRKPKPGGPTGQLYNLADDPSETTNQFSKHPEIVKELSELLREQKQAGRTR